MQLMNKDKPYIVAYYLFKYPEAAVQDLDYLNNEEAYKEIAEKLDMSVKTLRQRVNSYASLSKIDNQSDDSTDLTKKVHAIFSNYSKEQVETVVRQILDSSILLDEDLHNQILNKFQNLKGEELIGRAPVKGESSLQRVLPDQYVDRQHILHDLIRGMYKPKKKPYLLSYQATELKENYGEQIKWLDQSTYQFEKIYMAPPSRDGDARKISDIKAARYNLEHNIPIGLLYKQGKGKNIVLGLGKIIEETKNGIFIIEPTQLHKDKLELVDIFDFSSITYGESKDLISLVADAPLTATEVLTAVKQRRGQDKFRLSLLKKYNKCVLCGIDADHTIASHIKPWAHANHIERLDVNNGLLLCPNHDYLFDKGYITFENDGLIRVSTKLTQQQRSFFNIHDSMKLASTEEHKDYLAYHRDNLFIL